MVNTEHLKIPSTNSNCYYLSPSLTHAHTLKFLEPEGVKKEHPQFFPFSSRSAVIKKSYYEAR